MPQYNGGRRRIVPPFHELEKENFNAATLAVDNVVGAATCIFQLRLVA